MFYTKQQIDRLEKYRKHFETAIHSGYARNVGSVALKEIESIYDEALGHHYNYNSGCSVCVLSFIKRVGDPFLKESALYAAQEKHKEEEEEQQEQLPEPFEEPEVEEIAPEVPDEPIVLIETDEETPVQEEKPKIKRTTRKNKENGTE